MRSRIIGFLVTLILLLGYATTALASGDTAAIYGFPDDPGIPPGAE